VSGVGRLVGGTAADRERICGSANSKEITTLGPQLAHVWPCYPLPGTDRPQTEKSPPPAEAGRARKEAVKCYGLIR
jgi:hypothetical protein